MKTRVKVRMNGIVWVVQVLAVDISPECGQRPVFFFTTPGGTFKVVMADAHENRCKRQPFIQFLFKRKKFQLFSCV